MGRPWDTPGAARGASAIEGITAGAAWQDFAETWDETLGNGNPPGTVDYFTVAAQEIGHPIPSHFWQYSAAPNSRQINDLWQRA